MAHHETNVQRQGHVANLVYKKCSPQNYKRGGVSVGQKWGGWVQKLGGWVLSKIPPPLINEACTASISAMLGEGSRKEATTTRD